MEQFKELLEKKKGNLEKELSSFATKDPKVENDWDTKYPRIAQADDSGVANEVEEYGNKVPVEHSLELQLKAVNEALNSIEQGTYGKCLKCNTEISQERLTASPETTTCTECTK